MTLPFDEGDAAGLDASSGVRFTFAGRGALVDCAAVAVAPGGVAASAAFGLDEQAILFVVILGAAPSIANGVITGIDNVPPAFTRLGRVLGAGPVSLYRDVVLPAALPTYVSGLTQGWAFAWRSLMAGELLVIIAERPSLGAQLEFARQFSQSATLLATMLVILILGMVVDGLFSSLARSLRRRRGLEVTSS